MYVWSVYCNSSDERAPQSSCLRFNSCPSGATVFEVDCIESLDMIGIWNNMLLKLIIQYLSLSFIRTVSAACIYHLLVHETCLGKKV